MSKISAIVLTIFSATTPLLLALLAAILVAEEPVAEPTIDLETVAIQVMLQAYRVDDIETVEKLYDKLSLGNKKRFVVEACFANETKKATRLLGRLTLSLFEQSATGATGTEKPHIVAGLSAPQHVPAVTPYLLPPPMHQPDSVLNDTATQSGTKVIPVTSTVQINFLGAESLVLNLDDTHLGTFDSAPLVCPVTHDFGQGGIYRLKISNIPGYSGKELYSTLSVASARTQTHKFFVTHSSVPVEFTDDDFAQAFLGNVVTKVVYLPNPEFPGSGMYGVGTLVNTQVQSDVDPVIEASKRGKILAVIRLGNKDVSDTAANEVQSAKEKCKL